MIKTCSDERMTYMKKLVMLVTVVLTVAMAAVCFAAGDGNDLNKQQKIVDKFVAALTVADDSGYAGAAAGFSPELKQKMDVKAFAALQKQVKDTLGTMKEMKFVAYERFDQGDRLTYLGSYSKQQLVRVIYGIQWHSWFDHLGDGACLGLRKYADAPHNGEAKPVWTTYQKADTDEEDDYFEQYLSRIGIDSWEGIIQDIP